MKTSHGVIHSYDGVVAVDDRNQVIVHAQAFGQAQDHDMLKPMIEGARDKLKTVGYKGDALDETQVTADAGFHSEKNLKIIYGEGIDALIADKQFRKRHPKFADDLSHCISPAGQRLYRNGGDIYTQGKHNVRFKGPKSSCLPYKLRSKCLRHPERTQSRAVAYFTGRTKGSKTNNSQIMTDKIDPHIAKGLGRSSPYLQIYATS